MITRTANPDEEIGQICSWSQVCSEWTGVDLSSGCIKNNGCAIRPIVVGKAYALVTHI